MKAIRKHFLVELALIAAGLALPGSVEAAETAAPAMVRFEPGKPLDPAVLANLSETGKDLAPVVGKDAVLMVFWRPRDESSEKALVEAARLAQSEPKGLVFFPVAVLAAKQPHDEIGQRLEQLGLRLIPPRYDSGRLPAAFGLQQVPGFAVVDASGVLCATGGRKLVQPGRGGVTLAEAVRCAARRQAVPMLGALPQQPVYDLIGRDVPDTMLVPLDGSGPRSLHSCLPDHQCAVLVAWLPNCPHCKKLLADLRDWCTANRDAAPAVIGVTRADSPEQRETALAVARTLPFPQLCDTDRSFFRGLLVTLVPTVILVDGEGRIARVHVGGDLDLADWLGNLPAKKGPRSPA